MWVGRLAAGDSATLPDAAYVHAYVARGSVTLGDRTLDTGDAARLTEAGGIAVTAGTDAEIIVWESDAVATR